MRACTRPANLLNLAYLYKTSDHSYFIKVKVNVTSGFWNQLVWKTFLNNESRKYNHKNDYQCLNLLIQGAYIAPLT